MAIKYINIKTNANVPVNHIISGPSGATANASNPDVITIYPAVTFDLLIDGLGGKDTIAIAGNRANTVVYHSDDLIYASLSTGLQTIVAGTATSFDLRGVFTKTDPHVGPVISGFDILDLTVAGVGTLASSHTVRVDALGVDIFAGLTKNYITNTYDTMVIKAGQNDTIQMGTGWTQHPVTFSGITYHDYVQTITVSGCKEVINLLVTNRAPLTTADTANAQEDVTLAAIPGNVLTNDTDKDSDTLTVTSVNGVAGNVGMNLTNSYGTLKLNANGSYTYTLANGNAVVQALSDGETHNEVFSYAIKDGYNGVASSTLTVAIKGTNDKPVALTDSLLATEGVIGTKDFTFTDVDHLDTHTVTATKTSPLALDYGTLASSIAPDTTNVPGPLANSGKVHFSFNPIGNANAEALGLKADGSAETATIIYSYTVTDNHALSSLPQTLTVTLSGVNDKAVASNAFIFTNEDNVGSSSITFTDVDHLDTHTVIASKVSPAEDYGGLLSFIDLDTTNIPGPLANTGIVGFSFNPVVDANAQALSEGESKTITYNYTITDNHGLASDPQILTVILSGVNDKPVASDVSAPPPPVDEDHVAFIDVPFADVDHLDMHTVLFNPSGAYGTLTLLSITDTTNLSGPLALSSGVLHFIYDPTTNTNAQLLNNGDTGKDTFSLTINDGHENSAPISLSINVAGIDDNHPPVAVAEDMTTDQNTPLVDNIITHLTAGLRDTDPDPADIPGLTVTAVTGAFVTANGSFSHLLSLDPGPGGHFASYNINLDADTLATLTIDADGAINLAPGVAANQLALGESFVVDFDYTISDGHGGTSTVHDTVKMTGLNDAPVAEADKTIPLSEDPLTAINLNIAVPTDVDNGDVLTNTVTVTTLPTHGTIMKADNTIVALNSMLSNAELQGLKFMPDLNYSGDPGDFTYQVKDLANATDTQTIHFNITAVADTPNLTVMDAGSSLAGFEIWGANAFDDSGISVSTAGDINHDGFADLIVGAQFATPSGISNAGISYVIFGKASGYGDIDLNAFPTSDTTGFKLFGEGDGDNSGISVSTAGDINHDGFDDLLVQGPYADPSGITNAGISYVIFGKASGFTDINLSTLTTSGAGFKVLGSTINEQPQVIKNAGDINHDGFDDIIIGALDSDPSGVLDAGASYVVFGKASGFTDINLDTLAVNGEGFILFGQEVFGEVGISVSTAGDLNHDNFADLIIGADNADPVGRNGAGTSYVIFGKASGFSDIDLSTFATSDTTGFQILGANEFDSAGISVSTAGDINHDGFADLIIGADRADPVGRDRAGTSYVIFGKASGHTDIDLSTFTTSDTTGFKIFGEAAFDHSGRSVSQAGDINHDGFDDIIIGAPSASSGAGKSYVIFGKASGFADIDLSTLTSSGAGFKVLGEASGDRLGISVSAAGDLNHDGFADLIIGADGADPVGRDEAGTSYVIFGKASGFTDIDLSQPLSNQVHLDVAASLNDTDGSETLALMIGNVPTGAMLTLGTDQGSGNWLITGVDLSRLSDLAIIVAPNQANFTLHVTATATESSNLDMATTSHDLFVYMNDPVAIPTPSVTTIDDPSSFNIHYTDADVTNIHTASIVTQPALGTIVLNSIDQSLDNINFTFTPNEPALVFVGSTFNGTTWVGGSTTTSFTLHLDDQYGSAINQLISIKINADSDDIVGPNLARDVTVNGTTGNDEIHGGNLLGASNGASAGGASNNQYIINANSGDDIIYAHNGGDGGRGQNGGSGKGGNALYFITAGDGADTIYAGNGGNGGKGGTGNTTVRGGDGGDSTYSVSGGNGADIIHGGNGGNEGVTDFVTGGHAGNSIYTLNGDGGDDTIYVGASVGIDTSSEAATSSYNVNGGDGNDLVILPGAFPVGTSANVLHMNGGTGSNTLQLAGSAVTLNLTTIVNANLINFDHINLASGGNSLTLNASEVLNISATDVLFVDGSATSNVNAGTGWTDVGDIGAYHQWTNGLATLNIAETISSITIA